MEECHIWSTAVVQTLLHTTVDCRRVDGWCRQHNNIREGEEPRNESDEKVTHHTQQQQQQQQKQTHRFKTTEKKAKKKF